MKTETKQTHTPGPYKGLSGLDMTGLEIILRRHFHNEAVQDIVRAVNAHDALQNFYEAVMGVLEHFDQPRKANIDYIKRQAIFVAKAEGRASEGE